VDVASLVIVSVGTS